MPKIRKRNSQESGSALLVTIMITSVTLLLVMLFIERIIPYSQQVGGIHDAAQAYYTAKSQIELAKYELKNYTPRENIDANPSRILADAGRVITLRSPGVNKNKTGEFVVISGHTELPLQIKMFEKDALWRNFGTSQKDPAFHNFSTYGGGILLDLSKRNTSSPPFSLTINTDNVNANGNVSVQFIYTNGGVSIPFFGVARRQNGTISPLLNGKNLKDAENINIQTTAAAPDNNTLKYIFRTTNCLDGSCSLRMFLTNTSSGVFSLPITLSSSVFIPDLHAIAVADGLSKNTLYHSRIVELIPLTQSI